MIAPFADRAEAAKDTLRALWQDAAQIVARNVGDDAMHETERAMCHLDRAIAQLDDAVRRFVMADRT